MPPVAPRRRPWRVAGGRARVGAALRVRVAAGALRARGLAHGGGGRSAPKRRHSPTTLSKRTTYRRLASGLEADSRLSHWSTPSARWTTRRAPLSRARPRLTSSSSRSCTARGEAGRHRATTPFRCRRARRHAARAAGVATAFARSTTPTDRRRLAPGIGGAERWAATRPPMEGPRAAAGGGAEEVFPPWDDWTSGQEEHRTSVPLLECLVPWWSSVDSSAPSERRLTHTRDLLTRRSTGGGRSCERRQGRRAAERTRGLLRVRRVRRRTLCRNLRCASSFITCACRRKRSGTATRRRRRTPPCGPCVVSRASRRGRCGCGVPGARGLGACASRRRRSARDVRVVG